MTAKRSTYWITKYALTTGVDDQVLEVDPGSRYGYTVTGWRHQFVIGRDAFATRDEAMKNAADRVRRKLASIKKQEARLRQALLAFERGENP